MAVQQFELPCSMGGSQQSEVLVRKTWSILWLKGLTFLPVCSLSVKNNVKTKLSFDYFLLIGDIEARGTILTFLIRM